MRPRELWRGPDPGVNAAVGVHAALAFVVSKDDHLHALEIVTGREVWRMALATGAGYCASWPTVLDGVLYLSALAPMQDGRSADANANYVFALDAMTGQERWRCRADVASAPHGVCLTDQIVSATPLCQYE
jgi:outer membrane protein assembly factor BamB